MRKSILLAVAILVAVPLAFPAIVTNTNQSIGFFRLLARNASTDIDAVYYNPAGVTKLSDGFHLALSNQTITQDKKVTSNFPWLNGYTAGAGVTYTGEVRVPIYPDLYAVYKTGKLAFSFGFGPNAGGGGADYAKGLPSFETGYAVVPVILTLMGLPTTKYAVDINFKGSSIYYGFQGNVAYAVNDMISVAAGMRYIYAANSYTGSLRNFAINPYHPLFNPTAAMVPATQVWPLLGMNPAEVADKTVDAKQTGTGITPILSLHATPVAGLNLTVRYEFLTKLKLTYETTTDDTGMFPDGDVENADIPAILALGASYAILPQLRAHVSYSLFFEKDANWDGREALVNSNSYDLAFGLEFDVTHWLALSAGYLMSRCEVADAYQTDISHNLNSDTIGGGAKIKLGQFDIDLGLLSVNYKDAQTTINYGIFGAYLEKYAETTFGFGIGVGYHF